jgi:hypothetical protein
MCSLEEAFTTFSEVPSRPSAGSGGGEKRRKKRTHLLPPEPSVIEPDRPAHRPLPPAEVLGGPVTEYTDTPASAMLNAMTVSDHFPHPPPETENPNMYTLEPDWAKVFNDASAPQWIKDRLPNREAETPLIPSPWMDGAPSLWQRVPAGLANQPGLTAAEDAAESRLDTMQKRMESMFQKLEDLEQTRSESQHMEVILFVLGGIFLIFLIDLLVKQGTQASILLAAAGGSRLVGGGSTGFRKALQHMARSMAVA